MQLNLISNAGVIDPPDDRSPEGFEVSHKLQYVHSCHDKPSCLLWLWAFSVGGSQLLHHHLCISHLCWWQPQRLAASGSDENSKLPFLSQLL